MVKSIHLGFERVVHTYYGRVLGNILAVTEPRMLVAVWDETYALQRTKLNFINNIIIN